MRPALLIALLLGIGGAACGSPPPPGEVAPQPLFTRHWDQVCETRRDGPAPERIETFVDTLGLGAELQSAGVLSPASRDDPPTLSLVFWYRSDGEPQAVARWETTMDPATAATAESLVAARMRRTGRLLGETSVHAVLQAGADPTRRSERPVECIPHIQHPPQGRLYGLPDSVNTRLTSHRVRRARGNSAVVRLLIAPDGVLIQVDSVAGPGHLVSEARRIAHQLRFDPALRNGRPIPGTLTQAFVFRTTPPGPGRAPN